MSDVAPAVAAAPPQDRVLRRLFLMLFLRGRTSRGLGQQQRHKGAPSSIGKRLGMVLGFYAFFGIMALGMMGQQLFVLSLYLHAMTFMLLGMYVASSAGEVLFNKDEADILLHRPIEPRVLLRARISMLVQVSLWLAGAFNLAGLIGGVATRGGSWMFPLAHAVSVVLEAIFTTATVVVTYQLCLRWFGREKLDSLMTATQVLVAIVLVAGGQLVPQLMMRLEGTAITAVTSWWIAFLPPAWFAGMDEVLTGRGSPNGWRLAGLGFVATAGIVWVALTRLATDYQAGLQSIAESGGQRQVKVRRRFAAKLVSTWPLRWWLRDSSARASFLLVAAYLWRDRDVKLRVYPSLAPMFVLPIIALLPSRSGNGAFFGIGFGAAYLGLIPLMVLGLLTFSQQWQAADIFRLVPTAGPGAVCHGARRAVLLFIALPSLLLFAVAALAMGRPPSDLVMILPALITMPVFAMIPCLGGKAVPFSRAMETHRSATRSFYIFGAMFGALAIAGLAGWARKGGWLGWMLLGELLVCGLLYVLMHIAVGSVRWKSLE